MNVLNGKMGNFKMESECNKPFGYSIIQIFKEDRKETKRFLLMESSPTFKNEQYNVKDLEMSEMKEFEHYEDQN